MSEMFDDNKYLETILNGEYLARVSYELNGNHFEEILKNDGEIIKRQISNSKTPKS